MTNKIKNYLNNNMVLSRYGRDLISKNSKVKNAYDRNFFNTKKQTMVSKEEVDHMIEFAINRHNRNASLISMALGFTFLALFVDGLFRVLGLIPPFMGLDVNIIQDVVDKLKEEALKQM
tara:strand:+ start:414 stop:770 length:357 start_codon:yes stop_codon:yes gene_type:complete